MPIYRKVNTNFFKTWSHEMAYVLGFVFADGSIDTNPRGSTYLSIQITDKELLETIQKAIGSDHKIAIRYRKKETENTQYRLQIGGRKFCEVLLCHGITSNKAKTMAFPDVPNKYLSDFTRGYFDGDGNVWSGFVHKDRKTPTKVLQVAFTSCSSFFLQKLLQRLRENLSVTGSLYTHKKRGYSRIMFNTKDSLKIYRIMYNTTTSLFLERKKEVFEKFMRP